MSKDLSDFELQVLQVFWQRGRASAPEVHKTIQEARPVTYSTVKTIIDRLQEKAALQRCGKQGRTIFYEPAIQRDQMSRPLVERFVDRVFGGNRRPLLSHLLEEEQLDSSDLDYLEDLIARKKKEMGERR